MTFNNLDETWDMDDNKPQQQSCQMDEILFVIDIMHPWFIIVYHTYVSWAKVYHHRKKKHNFLYWWIKKKYNDEIHQRVELNTHGRN
jgi:hypothetical protein